MPSATHRSVEHSKGLAIMSWIIAGDTQLARYFEQEDVWSKSWEPVNGEPATAIDHRNEELALPIWESSFNGRRKRFAAKEVSNSVWIFALPKP